MARILITGSADGLEQLAAKALVDEGHVVYYKNAADKSSAIRDILNIKDFCAFLQHSSYR